MGFLRVFSEAESVCVCRLVELVKWEGDEVMEKCRFPFTLKASIVQCLFKARNGIAPPIGEVASTARHRRTVGLVINIRSRYILVAEEHLYCYYTL